MLAGLLTAAAMYKVRDEEIPRIALMTAAFFVASLIHVPIGPTSVHLLLNGLLGVVLGRRAPLAVLLGLTLQAVLLGHGGFTTIGVNTCVMALPALGAAWLFGVLHAGMRRAWFRAGLVAFSVVLWTLCLVYSIALLWLSRSTGAGRHRLGVGGARRLQPVQPRHHARSGVRARRDGEPVGPRIGIPSRPGRRHDGGAGDAGAQRGRPALGRRGRLA